MEFTKDIQFNNRPTIDQDVTITYHGFLSNSLELSIVYGFGEAWENTSEVTMQKTDHGFSATIKMLNFDTFHFCFRNNNYEWDNNSNCNYISPILPCTEPEEEKAKTFDIDQLIEEILQPIITKSAQEVEETTPIQITSNPIDLGVEITKVLSQIANEPVTQELIEYSTLDEILSGTVIEQTPIELFEDESPVDDIVEDLIEEIQEIEQEKSLIPLEDSFIISPRQLNKFYLFKKRLKLAFYKALVKIPKLIFGEENQ